MRRPRIAIQSKDQYNAGVRRQSTSQALGSLCWYHVPLIVLIWFTAAAAAWSEDSQDVSLHDKAIVISPQKGWKIYERKNEEREERITFSAPIILEQVPGKQIKVGSAMIEFAAWDRRGGAEEPNTTITKEVAVYEKRSTPSGRIGSWTVYKNGIHMPDMFTPFYDACYKDSSFVAIARISYSKPRGMPTEAERRIVSEFLEFVRAVKFNNAK
jgi:hypothetical protein